MAFLPVSNILLGSVNEFIDGALIIVIILIVYYILKFFFMFGEGRARVPVPGDRTFWDWLTGLFRRRPTPPGPTPPGPTPPGPTPPGPTPPDFTLQLNQFETELNNYDAQFIIFRNLGNRILTINQMFVASLSASVVGGAPRVSAAQWTAFYNELYTLNNIAGNINAQIGALTANPSFSRIIPVQSTRFIALSARWTGYLGRTQTYNTDFGQRYARGDHPA